MAALLAALGGQLALPAQPASAYNLMCCPFPRSKAPHLVGAIWPQHYFDNSSWFRAAVINGFNAWNDTPSAVFVSLEFVQDGNAQLLYWTDTNTSDSSTGGCSATNNNSECLFSVLQLVEGNGWMQESTPNYDQQSVAHEEGHGLGLDHSCVSGALMAGPAGPCPNMKYSCPSETNCVDVPQSDDINGMVAMYGNGSNSSYGGCSSTNPGAVPGPTGPNSLPSTPTLPGQSWLDSAESTVGAAKSHPGAFVLGVALAAEAATGKVVPWGAQPRLPVVTVPGGKQIDPNPQPC